MTDADFGEPVLPETKKSKVTLKDKKGEPRNYLKVYETLPVQLINGYGESAYTKMSDEEVWKAFAKPQVSGAQWMTELCSPEEERRGIGLNRFLLAMVNYAKYQKSETVKEKNKKILADSIFDGLNSEVDRMLPSFEYCLAFKKEKTPEGSSALRGKASQAEGMPQNEKSEETLKAETKKVYEWLKTDQRSYIRMMMVWQSCGGLSHVAASHHRGAQCFRYVGNMLHDEKKANDVSLEEFQASVLNRNSLKKTQGIVKVNNHDFD